MSTNAVSGDLRAFSIFDVTQSLMTGRKTAEVTVESGERRAFLYFRDGQIVAAIDDRLKTGEKAATNIFSWRGGTFSIDFDKTIDRENISVPTDYLLLEVARNLDEVRHEEGIDEDDVFEGAQGRVEDEVEGRFDDKLRTKLHSVFQRVASSVEPTRALYRSDAFDNHLKKLLDLEAAALFLHVGHRPLIRSTQGFESIDDKIISREEMDLFLATILNEHEQQKLRERNEVVSALYSGEIGSFHLHVARDAGGCLLTFMPLKREVPAFEQICAEPHVARTLETLTSGLVVIAGPMGSGKSTFVSSLVRRHMELRAAFCILFSNGHAHDIAAETGYCIQRDTPPPGAPFHSALRAALETAPDVLGIAETADRKGLRDAFHVALGASGGERLVLYSLDSQSPPDTFTRLLRLARTAEGDSLADALADHLRCVVDLRPGNERLPEVQHWEETDQALRESLLRGDLRALKERVIRSPSAP